MIISLNNDSAEFLRSPATVFIAKNRGNIWTKNVPVFFFFNLRLNY